jgi:hypothetical protein
MASTQLLVYAFGPDADFEGRLVGALERIETGGVLRIVEVLFLQSDPATGELSALGMRGDGAGRVVAPLLDFRLDERRRRRTTERALHDGTAGISGDELSALGGALEPGSAIAAVLLQHVWAEALDDAVSRTGGTPLADRFVDAPALTVELLEGLLPSATAAPSPPPRAS